MCKILICVFSLITLPLLGQEKSGALKISAGESRIQPMLQAWAVNDTTLWPDGPTFNFRLRRAELKFSGSIIESTEWFVMLDPAKSIASAGKINTDSKIVQDLGLVFRVSQRIEIRAGQFKTPTTAEGLLPSGQLPLPERSIVGRTFGDRREPGVSVIIRGEAWKVSTMVSNGKGPNTDDDSTSKDLNIRADLMPNSSVQFGAFTGLSDLSFYLKGVFGGNLVLHLGDWNLRWEGVFGRAPAKDGFGSMGEIGYFLTERLEPVVRFEYLRPLDVEKSADSYAETVGLNYFLEKHQVKIQAAATLMHNLSGGFGTPSTSDRSGTLLILAATMGI